VRDELEPGAGATATTYYRDELPYSGPDWQNMPEDFQNRMQELTVAGAMTREIVSASPDATVDELARRMLEFHVHRILIIDDGALLGVVAAFDLLRVLARGPAMDAGLVQHTGYTR